MVAEVEAVVGNMAACFCGGEDPFSQKGLFLTKQRGSDRLRTGGDIYRVVESESFIEGLCH